MFLVKTLKREKKCLAIKQSTSRAAMSLHAIFITSIPPCTAFLPEFWARRNSSPLRMNFPSVTLPATLPFVAPKYWLVIGPVSTFPPSPLSLFLSFLKKEVFSLHSFNHEFSPSHSPCIRFQVIKTRAHVN